MLACSRRVLLNGCELLSIFTVCAYPQNMVEHGFRHVPIVTLESASWISRKKHQVVSAVIDM